jgi:hypothetical protein
MFYFASNATTGLPLNSCKGQIIKDLQIGYCLYGSIFFCAGLCLFIAFNVQYGMWGRNLFKKMQKKGKHDEEVQDRKPKRRKNDNDN